ncbi:hypothetical protein FS842_006553 [Serendipita sp. 407]|nr:hypothetical protein FS842_006553 [Serendipita sp. 407]
MAWHGVRERNKVRSGLNSYKIHKGENSRLEVAVALVGDWEEDRAVAERGMPTVIVVAVVAVGLPSAFVVVKIGGSAYEYGEVGEYTPPLLALVVVVVEEEEEGGIVTAAAATDDDEGGPLAVEVELERERRPEW